MEHVLTRPGPEVQEGTEAPAVAGPFGAPEPGDAGVPGPGDAGVPGRARKHPAGGSWQRDAVAAYRRTAGWGRLDVVVVGVLVAVSFGLRWRTLWTSYWGDEAIAIGISGHALGALPHYLVNDGSPPLYYVVLHFWMRLFGKSEVATHALSMIPALAAIPAAWWSGRRLFGGWAGRAAAAMVATCAYLDYYATETRMYSWLVFTAILAVTCFVLAYRGAGRRYWVAAATLMIAVLYLQYYGLYLLAAAVIVGAGAAVHNRSWPRLRATLIYGSVCAAAFAPWAPQFLYQLRNTGAPWAPDPSVLDLFGDSFNAVASAGWAGIVIAIAVAVLGTRRSLRHRARVVASPLVLAAAVPLLTLLLAWVVGQFVHSWNPRYLGIAGVPALIPLAGGLARARRGGLALLVAVVAMAATAFPVLVDRNVTVRTSKSDVAYLLDELHGRLRPGALVISAEVTDTPVIALDLGKGYRYATPFGLLGDPYVVNWSDLPTRLQKINAAANLGRLLASVPVGGQVLIVNPTSWGGQETPERYAGPVEAEGIAANQVVLDDPELRDEVTEGVPRYSNPLYPMTANLFVKIRSGSR